MQVYVSTDESDVGSIHAGQEVNFNVDAFPTQKFKGKVSAVRLNATTVQNVVTYTTIVDFDNPELKLFPGMTAYVNIPVATANDVVKVPNGALRYTPDLTADELAAAYAKSGITAPAGKGKKAGQQASGQNPATMAVIWKMDADKQLEPVQIKLGITDHTTTEVAQVVIGALNAGDQVITGLNGPSPKAAGTTAAPGMGGARGGAGGGMRVGR